MGTTTARRWEPAVVVPAGLLGVVLAELLGGPASAGAATAAPERGASGVRLATDLSGSLVLGLGLLLLLTRGTRHLRGAHPWRWTALAAAVWAGAEVALLVDGAAAAAGGSVLELSTGVFADYLLDISAGRVGIATVAVAVGITVLAAVAATTETDVPGVLVVAPTTVALIARPVTGHMSQQFAGAPLIAAHVLAAAVWLGLLLAMALTLRTRTAWAALLPVYSRAAFWCVIVIVVTGVIDAAVRLGSVNELLTGAYGHLVIAKTVLAIALVLGGWWRRRTWVSTIADHRTDAPVSVRRAAVETAVMTFTVGVAAVLATTA